MIEVKRRVFIFGFILTHKMNKPFNLVIICYFWWYITKPFSFQWHFVTNVTDNYSLKNFQGDLHGMCIRIYNKTVFINSFAERVNKILLNTCFSLPNINIFGAIQTWAPPWIRNKGYTLRIRANQRQYWQWILALFSETPSSVPPSIINPNIIQIGPIKLT